MRQRRHACVSAPLHAYACTHRPCSPRNSCRQRVRSCRTCSSSSSSREVHSTIWMLRPQALPGLPLWLHLNRSSAKCGHRSVGCGNACLYVLQASAASLVPCGVSYIICLAATQARELLVLVLVLALVLVGTALQTCVLSQTCAQDAPGPAALGVAPPQHVHALTHAACAPETCTVQ